MTIPGMQVRFSDAAIAECLDRVSECLRSGQVAQGRNVAEFETLFATFVGAKHAVAVSSGGAALEAAMNVLEVSGKQVLVPTNTFAATAFAVTRAGGSLRLVDINPTTFSVDLRTLEQAVTQETAGLIIVHIGGIITPEIREIREWCDARGMWLFEDAAHAHGSRIDGRAAGMFGRAGAYSFFSTKVLTSGEGGMIVTDDDHFAERVKLMSNYGKPDPWVTLNVAEGTNWRMPELSAALGIVHLRDFPQSSQLRANLAQFYLERLMERPDLTPLAPRHTNWYKFIVLLPVGTDRDAVRARMAARGVSLSGGVYDIPLHRQPVFKGIAGNFPHADDVCARHICLPIYPSLSERDAEQVMDALLDAVPL